MNEQIRISFKDAEKQILPLLAADRLVREVVEAKGLLKTRELLGVFWRVIQLKQAQGLCTPEERARYEQRFVEIQDAMRKVALTKAQEHLVRWRKFGEVELPDFVELPPNTNNLTVLQMEELLLAIRISIDTMRKRGIDATISSRLIERYHEYDHILAGKRQQHGKALESAREKVARGETLSTRGRPPGSKAKKKEEQREA